MKKFMNLKLLGIIVVVISVVLLDFSNIYVPENFERPILYRTKTLFMKLTANFARLGAWLNLGSEPVIWRNILDILGTLGNKFLQTDESIAIENKIFDGIPVRIYTPKNVQKSQPQSFMIFYHGGIYLVGNLDTYDQFLSKISAKTNITIISVDYRLAPENPYPGPIDDCIRVTEYILQNTKSLNIDIERYMLAGDSAGGHAVAVVTQYIAKKGLNASKLQVLIYPWLQTYNFHLPSAMYYNDKGFLSNTKFTTAQFMFWLVGYTGKITEEMENITVTNNHTLLLEDEQLRNKYKQYLNIDQIPERYKKGKNYYETYTKLESTLYPKKLDDSNILKRDKKMAEMLKIFVSVKSSPVLADPSVLKLLPKAYFVIFEWDTLKDQGLIYAERLKQNGVEVEVAFYENAFHGVLPFIDDSFGYSVGKAMLHDLIKYIIKTF